MHYVNLAFYKFVQLPVEGLATLRSEMREFCIQQDLRGTVLLSTEGLNCCIAGTPSAIEAYRAYLNARPEFSNLPFKESLSDHQPFTRMLVKIKKEIIAFGVAVDPGSSRAPAVSPRELKKWLDEKKDVVLVDTRNMYETKIGTFKGALDMELETFRQFPEKAKSLPVAWKDKTVVTFCTGGIRCEKAAPLLKQYGFKDVYQLDGGILKYFEECGSDHYDGECFVFDYRVALDPKLQETPTAYCCNCQYPVTEAEQKSPHYVPMVSCPRCYVAEGATVSAAPVSTAASASGSTSTTGGSSSNSG